MPRLLLVGLVAGGAWLWQSGRFAQARELRWQVGEDRSSIREVEIQIWSAAGELLKREVFFFPEGGPAEIAQKVPLSDGEYLVRAFIKRAPGQAWEHEERRIEIKDKVVALPLRRSTGSR